MDSTQLEKIVGGLSNWFAFNEQVLEKVPAQKGVYVLRLAGARKIGRLNGESDIMYIGSNESEDGLGQRLSNYFHPGPRNGQTSVFMIFQRNIRWKSRGLSAATQSILRAVYLMSTLRITMNCHH
jgi:hypothetical protein